MLYMLMSDLTHISIPCKEHLNIYIENARYKFKFINSYILFQLLVMFLVAVSVLLRTPFIQEGPQFIRTEDQVRTSKIRGLYFFFKLSDASAAYCLF